MSSLSAGAHNVTDAFNGVESLQVETEQIFLMSLEVFHIFHSLHHQKRERERERIVVIDETRDECLITVCMTVSFYFLLFRAVEQNKQ